MDIWLDGQRYTLSAGTSVIRSPLVEWPDNVRLDGQQQRKDRRLLSSWAINDWAGGLGCEEINVGSTANLRKFYDAENIDTRNSKLVLSPQFVTCTMNPSYGNLVLDFEHQRQVYLVETGRANPALGQTAKVFQFSPPFTFASQANLMVYIPTITDGAGFAATQTVGSVMAIKSFGDFIGFCARHEVDALPVSSFYGAKGEKFFKILSIGESLQDGSYGISPSRSLWLGPSGAQIGTAINRWGEMAEMGGTLHLLNHPGNNTLFSLINSVHSAIAHVGSISDIVGTYLPPLVNDGLTMYAMSARGIWQFDNAPNIVVSTESTKEINGALDLYINKLYFKNRISTLEYDGTDVASRGYDAGDGLVAEKMHEATAYCSSWKYLFAAVKGATYSHILALDQNRAWQYYARVPSPGLWVRKMFLSNAPDDIDRLWILYDNYAYPGYFLNPIVNPLLAATYGYVPSGYFTPPKYGGDMSEELAGFFRTKLTADGVNGTNDVRLRYGLDGEVPSRILGLAGSLHSSMLFGSPVGLQGYRIQPQIELFRNSGDTGTTPIVREVIIEYLKDPAKRYLFEAEIDIEATSKLWMLPKEAVIGSLSYVANLKVLMPFWYGQMGTTFVKVLDYPSPEQTPETKDFPKERKGTVKIRLAEIIPQ